MEVQALSFTGPRRVEVITETLPAPGPGQVLVQSLVSAISPGTELLIFRGQAPPDLARDDTIAALAGDFSFPLRYGYSLAGRVRELGPGVEPAWQDRLVFAFQPHASHFLAAPEDLLPLPEAVTPEEAVFFPNLETAITLALDGRPLIGEQVVVFGQGIVGLLLTALLSRWPLAKLATLDAHPRRRLLSEELGAEVALDPAAADVMERLQAYLAGPGPYPGADLTYELSGNPAALDLALAATGFSGRVVIGSWYGIKKSNINLGGRFHRSRIHILSSQVSRISPELTGRWDNARRWRLTWEMLERVQPARFITQRFPLAAAAEAYRLIDTAPGETVQVLLTYEDGRSRHT